MGYAQFMPTNILAYAQDGDQDGRIDLLIHADADRQHRQLPQTATAGSRGSAASSRKRRSTPTTPASYYVNAILKVADLLKG
ncbi:MAG: lytic murein transglycosylase [Desulfobacterales bacterium]|nr:lytic murein transglycosylase [Desulfobacterales bacterium]